MLRLSRRQFVQTLVGTVTAGFGAAGYARYIEPSWLDVTTTSIRAARTWDRSVRILFLTDLHLSAAVPLAHIEHAFELGLQHYPDIICLGGDYVTGQLVDEKDYAEAFRRLSQAAPTFATFGNHDGGSWAKARGGYEDPRVMIRFLEGAGVTCLWNAHTSLRLGDVLLNIVAVGDEWSSDVHAERAFEGLSPDAYTVILCHNPDSKTRLSDYAWDLMLCGHTHGGQLVVPFLGSAPFAPVLDKRFVAGLHEFNKKLIYTSRGVGNIGSVRFNCRPEVTVITLQ